MTPVSIVEGVVAPLDRADVDTDAIIPKQFMASIERTGYGMYLFDSWRYLDPGYPGKPLAERTPNPEFVLNLHRYREASILLTRANFGCGSSREHALWALTGFGIRAVLAPSFADIFRGNCFKNGVLPVELPGIAIDRLFDGVHQGAIRRLRIDLAEQNVITDTGEAFRFEVDPVRKQRLLEGLDDIDVTLRSIARIAAYEQRRAAQEPWLFGTPPENPR